MTLPQDSNSSNQESSDESTSSRSSIDPAGVISPPLPPPGVGWGYHLPLRQDDLRRWAES